MELTKEFIETSLSKAVDIFKEADICEIDNEIAIEFIDSNKFLQDAKANMMNKLLIDHGFIKDFDREYPSFLVVYQQNKHPMRKIFDLPYSISIDFNRAKRFLMPYSKSQVEKYFVTVSLHEITHIFENKIIEKNQEFYNSLLVDNRNVDEAAKEDLAEVVAHKYGYSNLVSKIDNDLNKDIYSRMRKFGYNFNSSKKSFDNKIAKFNKKTDCEQLKN